MISPLPITIMHIIRSSPSSSDTIRRRTIPNFFSFGTRKPAPPPKPFISSSSLSSVSSTSHEAKSPPGSLDIAGAGFERQVVLSEEQLRNPPETFSNDLAAILFMDSPAKPSQTVTGVCFRKEVVLTEEELNRAPALPKAPMLTPMLTPNLQKRFSRRHSTFVPPTPVDLSTLVRSDVPLVVEHVGTPALRRGPAPAVDAASKKRHRHSLFVTSAPKSDAVCEGW
ncbi:unnamed protein product [Mycena citricolor]|uniref:Uncharacterized protein n=1 Tax=Mycena citricolor TaxID=2018698 RepID=A0AAD2HW82_9AGAR|nr:unnamed protein product [Mycena citricolor]